MVDWLPSLEEQDIAEKYVLMRPLPRPNTSYKKAVICVLVYIMSNLLFSALSYALLNRLGIFFSIPAGLNSFRLSHPHWFVVLYYLAVFLVSGIIMSRFAVIGCIRLYQRYADEDVRRRCLFRPTCSEYAILVVKKYGVIVGLIKAAIRLIWKCRGNVYRIDYP
jgi:putative membrane protein insertion efficiency factor